MSPQMSALLFCQRLLPCKGDCIQSCSWITALYCPVYPCIHVSQGKQITSLGYHHMLNCELQWTTRHGDLFSCLHLRATSLKSELQYLPPVIHKHRKSRNKQEQVLLSCCSHCMHLCFTVPTIELIDFGFSSIFNSISLSKSNFPIQFTDVRTAANYMDYYGLVDLPCLKEKCVEQLHLIVKRYSPYILLLAPLQAQYLPLRDKHVVRLKTGTTSKHI